MLCEIGVSQFLLEKYRFSSRLYPISLNQCSNCFFCQVLRKNRNVSTSLLLPLTIRFLCTGHCKVMTSKCVQNRTTCNSFQVHSGASMYRVFKWGNLIRYSKAFQFYITDRGEPSIPSLAIPTVRTCDPKMGSKLREQGTSAALTQLVMAFLLINQG